MYMKLLSVRDERVSRSSCGVILFLLLGFVVFGIVVVAVAVAAAVVLVDVGVGTASGVLILLPTTVRFFGECHISKYDTITRVVPPYAHARTH